MLLEVLMKYSCIISHLLSSLERRFRDILIVIITNFVVVSSVGIKRVDCIYFVIVCFSSLLSLVPRESSFL